MATACPGDMVQLFSQGAASVTWQPGNLVGTSTSVVPQASTIYTAVGTGTFCGTVTSTIAVTVLPAVSLSVVATQTSICAGGSATLTAFGAGSYTWQPGNVNSPSLAVSPLSSQVYTVSAGNSVCPVVSQTVSMVVLQPSNVSVQSSNAGICAGTTATLTAAGAQNYLWSPGNLSGTSVTVSPISTTIYTATASNGICGSSSATLQLTVFPAPVLSISPVNPVICAGQPLALVASGGMTYSWTPGNSNSAVLQITPFASSSYTVYSSNELGCKAQTSVLVKVDPCTGIVNNVAGELLVYPNPASGQVMVTGARGGKLQLYDVSGKLLTERSIQNEPEVIDLNLAKGLYLLNVHFEQMDHYQRLLIE
jgi:hypothetical protein